MQCDNIICQSSRAEYVKRESGKSDVKGYYGVHRHSMGDECNDCE